MYGTYRRFTTAERTRCNRSPTYCGCPAPDARHEQNGTGGAAFEMDRALWRRTLSSVLSTLSVLWFVE